AQEDSWVVSYRCCTHFHCLTSVIDLAGLAKRDDPCPMRVMLKAPLTWGRGRTRPGPPQQHSVRGQFILSPEVFGVLLK
ncbi:hypothetical protein BHE74_00022267, partial [Ensete ventricosum]